MVTIKEINEFMDKHAGKLHYTQVNGDIDAFMQESGIMNYCAVWDSNGVLQHYRKPSVVCKMIASGYYDD